MKKSIDGYIKLGRISMATAKEAHIKAGDIKIDEKHIKHVAGKHAKELDKLAISAADFVRIIVENYNQIRKAQGDALYLAYFKDEEHTNVAIISLFYSKKEFWEIKTAIPMRTAVLLTKKLVWKKGANPLK